MHSMMQRMLPVAGKRTGKFFPRRAMRGAPTLACHCFSTNRGVSR
jgi:hypothetical protein